MANISEFLNSPNNPSSPLYTGVDTYIPPFQARVKPSYSFFIGANGDATLAVNGRLIITEGVAGAKDAKTSSFQWTRIHPGSFRRILPTTATAKVATVTVTTPDYANSNPNGLTEIHLFYQDKRIGTPVRQPYVFESPASAGQSNGDRAKRLVSLINGDGNSLVTATSLSAGTDAQQAVITLTAKTAGYNVNIYAGQGTSGVVTVTTPSADEFGTSKFVSDQGYGTADANKTGKTFVVVDFKVDVPTPAVQHGTFVGREVGNNAYVFEEKTVRLFFEVGAGDAKFTAFNTLAQGKATPASSYYAKAGDLTA